MSIGPLRAIAFWVEAGGEGELKGCDLIWVSSVVCCCAISFAYFVIRLL